MSDQTRTFDVSWDGDAPWDPIEATSAKAAAEQFVQSAECVIDGDQTVTVRGHGRYFVTEIEGDKVARLVTP